MLDVACVKCKNRKIVSGINICIKDDGEIVNLLDSCDDGFICILCGFNECKCDDK